VTPKTSKSAVASSIELTRVPRSVADSVPGKIERRSSLAYWRSFFSLPAFDFAEAIIRLRRRRGVSQEELASKLGTHQPAIARLESGEGNPRLQTLVHVANALDAVVRVQVVTIEELQDQLARQPWMVGRSEVVTRYVLHRKSSESLALTRGAFAQMDGAIGEERVPVASAHVANSNFALAG